MYIYVCVCVRACVRAYLLVFFNRCMGLYLRMNKFKLNLHTYICRMKFCG